MKVFFMRHGEANSSLIDLDRSLTEKGRYEVTEVANCLKSYGIEDIYHSGILRAKQTAEIVKDIVLIDKIFELDFIMPNDPLEPFIYFLESVSKNTLFVGHQPFIENFVSTLFLGDSSDIYFRQAEAIVFERINNTWAFITSIFPNKN